MRRRNNNKRKMALARPLPNKFSIPPYTANSIVSRIFRFVYGYASGPLVYTITPAKLCALQVIGTGSTTAAQIYEAVKVRKVEMWANSGSGAAMQLACTFGGNTLGITGSNQTFSDSNVGMTYPAHVIAVPSKLSQAAQWQSGDTNVGTNTLFTITFSNTGALGGASVAITIDVHVALRMTGNARTSNNSVTLVTSAAGAFYHLALDNPAGSTGSVGSDLGPDRVLVSTT